MSTKAEIFSRKMMRALAGYLHMEFFDHTVQVTSDDECIRIKIPARKQTGGRVLIYELRKVAQYKIQGVK